jgi:hypothetical protein
MNARACAVLACLVMAAFTGPAGASVSTDARPGVDFARYETYSWKLGTPARHEKAQTRIVRAVGEQLVRDGFVHVATEPDLYVTTHVLPDKHTLEELNSVNQWDFWTGMTDVDAFDLGAGTLIVDFVDVSTGDIVWRGLVTETVRGTMNEKTLKRIDKVVARLFKKFPPKN